MLEVSVRRTKPEDAAAACRVVRDSIKQCCAEDHEGDPMRLDTWLSNKTPDNFLAWIQRDDLCCFVAEDEAGVVGFGMVSAAGELLLCYAASSVRFQGVGKAMLQEMERWAVAVGLTGLRLESTKTALPFYERHGFKASGPATTFAGMGGQPMSKRLSRDAGAGRRLKLLFVCSRNQWRSPTAEQIWRKRPGVQARSGGTSPNARHTVSVDDVLWADVIFVMEQKHKSRLAAEFTGLLAGKPVHVLDIPDEYKYMDPELVEMLEQSVASILYLP